MQSVPLSIAIPDGVDPTLLCGPSDAVFREIETHYDVRLGLEEQTVTLRGSAAHAAEVEALIKDLIDLVQCGVTPKLSEVKRSMNILDSSDYAPAALRKDVLFNYHGHTVRPKTAGQKRYCDAIRNNTITFGIGPAGTGKTYLAMALALNALQAKQVSRIILARPVVEAGEALGFLPGTLEEKVDPYVRPLYDALFDMTDPEKGNMLLAQGVIEIVPLAFMRGRTFNDAFIILDEAQNTTNEQMKMFLTRLGFGSKMVITGDITQLDLPHGVSGLRDVRSILEGVDDIVFCDFDGADVVRHTLVSRIVKAYEAHEEN